MTPEERKLYNREYARKRRQRQEYKIAHAAYMRNYTTRPETRERRSVREAQPAYRAYRLFSSAKARAAKFGIMFDLDLDFVLSQMAVGACPVTGVPFEYSRPVGTAKNPWAPSIDRKNNSLGYTRDNVQIVCVWWNLAKNEWSEEVNKKAVDSLRTCTVTKPLAEGT